MNILINTLKQNTMGQITKIYVDADGQPIITHYNGSWHVIKHESTDGLDYSISIWDTIYEGIYQAEQSIGEELTDEQYTEEVAYIIDSMADCFEFEIVVE